MPETKPKPKPRSKKKPVRYRYPSDAINPADALSKVVFFGSKFKPDERNALYRADLSMSLEEASQIEFALLDPWFDHLAKGVFSPGIPVQYEDMFLEVASVQTQAESGQPAVQVACRPQAIRKLKNLTGSKVLRNVSPSQFVQSECRKAGVKCVVQKTHKQKAIHRDTKKRKGSETEPGEKPSAWTTLKRLAYLQGFTVFESMGKVYFGKPTWLMERHKDDALPVVWTMNPGTRFEAACPTTVPQCSRSADRKGQVELSFSLNWTYGRKFRPGMAMKLQGVPTYNGLYIVKTVTYSLLNQNDVQITAGTPIDPEKPPKPKKNSGRRSGGGAGGGGGYQTSSLRKLLENVGFSGNGLDIAIAVCMAESGGRANALGDTTITDAKWGPSVGLFQIRSLKQPGAYSGLDTRRDRRKLLNPVYNATTARMMSNGGQNWGAWSAYTSGAYRTYLRTGKDYQVQGWSMTVGGGGGGDGDGSGGSGATGARSASAFVTLALRQAGDSYVWGASPSGSNPSAFDCSALVQWAAGRVGVSMPRVSGDQINACRPISVSTAIRTRGALLWHEGHVAISLGNGRTIEAANPGAGVISYGASGRFARGGLLPGMRY